MPLWGRWVENSGSLTSILQKKTLLKDRLTALMQTLEQEPVKQYSVTYLYYTRSDSPLPDVCLDAEYPGSLRAIVNS